MNTRGSGVLLHITSLPSLFGIGDLGPNAYAFGDFLSRTKQKYWQILPLNPTDPVTGNSPYSSISAFAGNTLIISPELLMRDGYLNAQDISTLPPFLSDTVDFQSAIAYKERLLNRAYEKFSKKKNTHEYETFCTEHALWLDDYALFVALKLKHSRTSWNTWPEEIKRRDPDALNTARQNLSSDIAKTKFSQYIFFTQWQALKNYCNNKGIRIIGDIPIYVNYDSSDVWAHPELFKLDKDFAMTAVAGVPPDYFSKTGQHWGNPVYKWKTLKETKYTWWIERLKHNFKLVDITRIDHFRGFQAYWEIPAAETTAVNGKWVEAPGDDFFKTLQTHVPHPSIIAEDLGVITDEVRTLIKTFNFPGMKILLFAFGDDNRNPYLPHNHHKNCVVYTGTHDNNTVKGWYLHEANLKTKKNLLRYFGMDINPENIHWSFIRVAMMSVARTVIIPMQDILGLDADCRMNTPGTVTGNWQWRYKDKHITQRLEKILLNLTETYDRAS